MMIRGVPHRFAPITTQSSAFFAKCPTSNYKLKNSEIAGWIEIILTFQMKSMKYGIESTEMEEV